MHRQIRDFVLQRIASGEWRTNDKIMTESQFVAMFGVSRMTVHHALRDLQNEGVLARTKGRGTFVAQPTTHMTIIKVRDIALEIVSRGHQHSSRVIGRVTRPATSGEAARFRLPIGSTLFHSTILHFENDLPVQIEDRLVNPKLVPDYATIDLDAGTSVQCLMELFPYPEGEHVIRAIEPNTQQRDLLRLQSGEPALELERTTWVAGGVVTIAKLVHAGSRYKIHGTIKLP